VRRISHDGLRRAFAERLIGGSNEVAVSTFVGHRNPPRLDRPRLLKVVSQPYEGLGVLVRVEDSGAGIASSDANRMFQPFFTTKAKGMGMGLAICRSIAEAHHGKLWASPGARFGTVFHLVLPAAEQHARDTKALGQPEKVLHDGPVKVA